MSSLIVTFVFPYPRYDEGKSKNRGILLFSNKPSENLKVARATARVEFMDACNSAAFV